MKQSEFTPVIAVLMLILKVNSLNMTVYSTEGETVILECPGQPVLLWRFNSITAYGVDMGINKNLAISKKLSITKENGLVIKNITTTDLGTFVCETSEPLQYYFAIQLKYKPYLVERNMKTTFVAKIAEPNLVSLNVGSYTKPDVSWTENSGEKLGYWNVYEERQRIFNVSSSIVLNHKDHLGRYSCRVRNSVGSIDIYIDLVGGNEVTVFPESAECNISSHITFACNISAVEKISIITTSWVHLHNEKTIRTFSSNNDDATSFLRISHSDYRDTGISMCERVIGKQKYSASTKLIVNSSPIYASQRTVFLYGNVTRLDILFYAVPKPDEVIWFYKDRPVDDLTQQSVELKPNKVLLPFQSKMLETDGYIASIVIDNSLNADIGLYSCQVRNSYGSMDARFKDIPISEYYTTGDYESNNEFNFYNILYGGGSFVALILIAVFITGIIVKLRKKALAGAQDIAQEEEHGYTLFRLFALLVASV